MAAEALTYGAFLDEVLGNHDATEGMSKNQVKNVLEAAAAELGDCLASGYKVNIPGFGNYKPVAKKGRKKGTVVRNPFDGSTRKLKETEPDSIKIKVVANAKLKDHLPEPGTADARKLVKAIA